MSKFVALHAPLRYSPFLYGIKQKALLFDQIGVIYLNRSLEIFWGRLNSLSPMMKEDEGRLLELEWLLEKEVLFPVGYPTDIVNTQNNLLNAEIQDLLSLYQQEILNERERLNKFKLEQKRLAEREEFERRRKNRNLTSSTGLESNAPLMKMSDAVAKIIWAGFNPDDPDPVRHQNRLDSILVRILALHMVWREKTSVVPLLPESVFLYNIANNQQLDVANIVLSQLPMPGDETPWEKVLDYRSDPKNQQNLLSLRRWTRKIASENLSPAEIEDELLWLMNEFRHAMDLHKIESNVETLEIFVKAPLEILEDLVKLKFSKIPEPFFALKKRKLSLMEAEINAPGREIAYILNAQQEFGT